MITLSEEVKKKSMHVIFKDQVEYDRIIRMRGKRKWKDWLLTLPDQFRTLTERVELYQRRSDQYEQENNDLKERIRVLQEQIGDA